MRSIITVYLICLLGILVQLLSAQEPKKEQPIKLTQPETQKAEVLRLRRDNLTYKLKELQRSVSEEIKTLNAQESAFLEEVTKSRQLDSKTYQVNAEGTALIKRKEQEKKP